MQVYSLYIRVFELKRQFYLLMFKNNKNMTNVRIVIILLLITITQFALSATILNDKMFQNDNIGKPNLEFREINSSSIVPEEEINVNAFLNTGK